MNYKLEYRYGDSNDGVYSKCDLKAREIALIDKLLDMWGLPEDDMPTEVSIVLLP